jgi:hypothetical protein
MPACARLIYGERCSSPTPPTYSNSLVSDSCAASGSPLVGALHKHGNVEFYITGSSWIRVGNLMS